MVATDAFASLYNDYRPLVYGTVQKILHNALDAEDVTQSIFMKLWANPNAFRGGNIEGWLTRVARNGAIDVIRKRKHEIFLADNLDASAPTSPDDVSGYVVQRLLLSEVLGSLCKLREDQRALLRAAYFGGVSHDLLAKTTELPLGTVKSLIRGGILRLREELCSERPRSVPTNMRAYQPRPNRRIKENAASG